MNSRLIPFVLLIFTALSAIESDLLEYDETASLLDIYAQAPMNINTATVSDIYELPYIDEVTAELIYRRIEEKGEINSLEILVGENILSSEYAEALKSCIKFTEGKRDVRSGYYSLRFTRRFEESEAYIDSVYLGNRSRFNQKFGLYGDKVSMNLIVEKEPGEANYTDNMKGNFVYNDAGGRIIIGDFNVNSATGMLQKEGFVLDQYSFTSSKDFHNFTSPTPSSNDYSGYTGASLYYTFADTRLSIFGGRKYLSGILNGDGDLESVNLYAYTRTLTETGRYHNAAHVIAGVGLEGSGIGIRYAASVTNEKFDRKLAPTADLIEGTTGELSLQKFAGEWIFKAEAASDLDKFDLKLNARMRSKVLTTGFFYGFVQQDKFCLSSPGMFFGNGDEEHVFGMKFNIRLSPELIVISENLIFSTVSDGTSYPGSKFSLKTVLKWKNVGIEPYFGYKYSESSDDYFVLITAEEYQAKLKIKYTAGPITSSSYISY